MSLSAGVPSCDDLKSRIARLEQLLNVDTSVAADISSSRKSSTEESSVERLTDLASLIQRPTRDLDDGDAIAMRALVQELREIAADLRSVAAAADRRLTDADAKIAGVRAGLKELEKIG